MRLTVLVPTYRRPDDLSRCLSALKRQVRLADEVLVTVRDCDADTWIFLKEFEHDDLPLKVLKLDSPGQVFALNAGLSAAIGDVIAITDDDAAPHSDWLQQIEEIFSRDSRVGGVGGRDWMYLNGELQTALGHPGASSKVGRVQWFGRIIGNHHIGEGDAQEVEILKGANMSYRKSAISDIRFEERLLGDGAQPHNDMCFSLTVRKHGWKLIYSPSVSVDHFLGRRFSADRRTQKFNSVTTYQSTFNETLTLLLYLSIPRKTLYFIWSLLVGSRVNPGIFQLFRLNLLQQGNDYVGISGVVTSISARFSALKVWRNGTPSV